MSLDILLMLFEIILLTCKFPNIGIEVSTDDDLELSLVFPIDIQQMSHKDDNLFVLFILPGAKMQRHHEELISEADSW